MALVCAFGVLLLAATSSYFLHRRQHEQLRRRGLFLLQGLCAGSPWLLHGGSPFERFVVALAALFVVVRVWEVRRRVYPEAVTRGAREFFTYFLTVPDVDFDFTAQGRERARRSGTRRVARGILKGGAVLALFVCSTLWPELHGVWWAHTIWALWAVYFAASGVMDVFAGVLMWLSGQPVHEMFVNPAFARSPRDFWSRRWNLMFRNSAHRLIFQPLREGRPLMAVVAVFMWSALVHEYLVIAALGQTRGHMTAFFALQGAATLLEGLWKRRWRMSRGWAVAFHLCWLIATAPLFFSPLRAIVPAHEYHLW